MTIVERAVEAAKQALLADPKTDAYMRADDPADDFLIDGNVCLTTVVRAVLQAIREPSDDMEAAGKDALGERGCNPFWGDAGACYQAMIDTALTE
jgi:hypothetical protein